MKKLILILSTIIFLTSCGGELKPSSANNDTFLWKTVTFDSCEYVKVYDYGGLSIAHKGNCKFCKQRNIK